MSLSLCTTTAVAAAVAESSQNHMIRLPAASLFSSAGGEKRYGLMASNLALQKSVQSEPLEMYMLGLVRYSFSNRQNKQNLLVARGYATFARGLPNKHTLVTDVLKGYHGSLVNTGIVKQSTHTRVPLRAKIQITHKGSKHSKSISNTQDLFIPEEPTVAIYRRRLPPFPCNHSWIFFLYLF